MIDYINIFPLKIFKLFLLCSSSVITSDHRIRLPDSVCPLFDVFAKSKYGSNLFVERGSRPAGFFGSLKLNAIHFKGKINGDS